MSTVAAAGRLKSIGSLLGIPLARTLSHRTRIGVTGSFLAVTVAFPTLAVASGAIFRRGRWKLTVV